MKFLKAYWILILAVLILIIAGYFYYDLTMQLAALNARTERLSAFR